MTLMDLPGAKPWIKRRVSRNLALASASKKERRRLLKKWARDDARRVQRGEWLAKRQAKRFHLRVLQLSEGGSEVPAVGISCLDALAQSPVQSG